MDSNLEVKFQASNGDWFCFRHAVTRAFLGHEIAPVIDDFSSDYDMRDTTCVQCKEAWGNDNSPD